MTENIVRKNTSTFFDSAARAYHEHAKVQKQAADRLIASLKPWKEILPAGPVIELGCGTGFLSRQLADLLPERELVFTDIAPGMIDFTREQLGSESRFSYTIQDAETVPVSRPAYSMAISSFAAQWFRDPAYTLGKWLEAIKPGGLLLAAFPGNESFPEWKKCTRELGLPFTGNELPDTEEMVVKLSSGGTQVDYYEDTATQYFEHAVDFFRHLKQIGAGNQLTGRPLSAKEMRLLLNHWDEQTTGGVAVSYHLVFLAVKKNFTP